jgi:DNA-binding CsgD family transcriptional regulator
MELAGRHVEVAVLAELLGRLPERGGVVLVRGRRGDGKTALLAEAGRLAARGDLRVMRAAGSPARSATPYAALRRLARPLWPSLERLPAARRAAVRPVLVPGDRAPVDRFDAGLALLDALAVAAVERPVVLLLDDVHAFDAASLASVTFLARRAQALPLVIVASADIRSATALDEAWQRHVDLTPLARVDADALSRVVAPGLPDRLRVAVIDEAQGNPLAIGELASAASRRAAELLAYPAADLPVTPRLASVLREDLEDLPGAVRVLLHAAALEADATVAELMAASGRVAGQAITLADVGAAVGAGLAVAEGGRLRLVGARTRLGLLATAAPGLTHALHAAFAASLKPGSLGQVLHRAATASSPDDGLATAVAAAAVELRRQGRIPDAARAFELAAELSDGDERVHRLLSASTLALELGLPAAVRRLLARAQRRDPPAPARALIAWQQRLLVGEWPPPDDEESERLIGALVATPDADVALTALMPLALGCWWADPSPRIRTAMRTGARRIALRTTDPRVDAIAALAGPAEAHARVRARIGGLRAGDLEDPLDALHLAIAAEAVGAWREAHRLLAPAVEQLRRRPRSGALAHALLHQSYAALRTGDWAFSLATADESRDLAERASRPRQALGAMLLGARAAALAAPRERAPEAYRRAEAGARRSGLPGADAFLRAARASAAMADGDPQAAYEALARLYPLGAPAHTAVRTGWELFDFLEAAAAVGQREVASAVFRVAAGDALRQPGSLADKTLMCARPLAACADAAEELFAAALAQDLTGWPFLRARTLLAYGEWLHARRRPATAVGVLRNARDELSMLGARGYVERARRNLRAAGAGQAAATAIGPALTPHELRIARLAASGLTNGQIGMRLSVSARTVGSHLYRIFPKLGITSRTQLERALARAAGAER